MSTAPAAERERVVGVLGVALGLLLLLGAIAMLFGVRGGPVDGAQRVATIFKDAEPPFGLELQEAAQLPSGEVVVRLAPGAALSGSAASRAAAGDEEKAAGAAGEARAYPDEVVLVEFPSMRTLSRLFDTGDQGDEDDDDVDTEASLQKMAWEEDPSSSFAAEIQSGRIAWKRWQADFRVVRAYLESGSWQESARVNLGQEKRPLVLFVRWPPATPHSEEDLQTLLRSIEMLAPKEESAR